MPTPTHETDENDCNEDAPGECHADAPPIAKPQPRADATRSAKSTHQRLEDSKRANESAVDTTEQERQDENEDDNGPIPGKQGRNALKRRIEFQDTYDNMFHWSRIITKTACSGACAKLSLGLGFHDCAHLSRVDNKVFLAYPASTQRCASPPSNGFPSFVFPCFLYIPWFNPGAAVWHNHGTHGCHGRKRPRCGLFLPQRSQRTQRRRGVVSGQ